MEKTENSTLIEQKILDLAEEESLKVTENLSAIARAKERFFGLEAWQKCPCDRDGTRACGSIKCLNEIFREGHCHCNLFERGF